MLKRIGLTLVFAYLSLLFTACTSTAEPSTMPNIPSLLRDIHRIVFIGDSITQAGDYMVDVECWCLVNGLQIEFLNAGLSSETATELTTQEAQGHIKIHGFARPFVGERLIRSLTTTQPDMLIICYGMNDATSLPSGDEGLNRYTDAITAIHQTALQAGVKRVPVCSPPVYDNKKSYPENKPDQNLESYTKWLLSKRQAGWDVADIHTPMRKSLDAQRQQDPKFAYANDGIHPDRAGHWIMTKAILHDALVLKLNR